MRSFPIAILSLVPAVALAQTPVPAGPPFREGTAEASFVGTTGNSSTQSVGLAAELVLRPKSWETRVKAGYVQNSAGGITKAQTLTALARAQKKVFGGASFFAQYTYLADKFAGTDARHTADIGIAGQLIQTDTRSLVADAGGGYATDKRVAGSGTSTAIASAGALFKQKVSATADFSEEARFVGAVPDGGDWRYTNVAALSAKVNSTLSLKVANTVRYVNRPVTGFTDTDVQTSVALVAKF